MTKTHALEQAKQLVGGFTQTSKMPGLSYSIPASECKIGQILAKRSGSVCHGCYALKGRYLFKATQSAMKRRADLIRQNPEVWADNIIRLLPNATTCKDFRWHDSGDIQSMAHLLAIVRIARELPDFRFWLPSKEYATVRQFLAEYGAFPENLIVRLSAPMVGDTTFRSVTGYVSYVADSGANCPAYTQGGVCGDCRNCWDKTVQVIIYKKH